MDNSKRNPVLSPARTRRLRIQGFVNCSDEELSALAPGIRFAYALCVFFVAVGLALKSVPLLLFVLIVAFFGTILPNHPFDYLYNSLVRKWIGRPPLPHRPAQSRFACGIATAWLALIILLFLYGLTLWGYAMGALLLVVALLVTATDICIPSMIYNRLFKRKT